MSGAPFSFGRYRSNGSFELTDTASPSRSRNLPAMGWMLASSVLFSANFAIIRILGEGLPVLEIVFFRNLFIFLFLVPILLRQGRENLKTRHPWLVAIRGILHAAALSFWYVGLINTPLAPATALGMLEPIFVAIFAALFLKESTGAARWVASLFGFVGTLIIIRPGFEAVSLGALSVVASAAIWAVYIMMGKVHSRAESATLVTAYPVALTVFIVFIPMLFVWITPTLEQMGWLILSGAVAGAANVFLTRAYGMGDASAVAPVTFTRMIFAASIGFAVFSEVPVIWTWIGGGVIFAAGWYLMRTESSAEAKRSPQP